MVERAQRHEFQQLELDASSWQWAPAEGAVGAALDVLERGGIVVLPRLDFPVDGEERRVLFEAGVALTAKNLSFDPLSGRLKGGDLSGDAAAHLRNLLERYARLSMALVKNLLPRYANALVQGKASYRPADASNRSVSWRKDDRRLHVDAFPSNPVHGKRMLRVFTNINPHGTARVWRVGEPFEAVAARFAPRVPRPVPGSSALLSWLGVTKSRRTDYDHLMLHIHDRMKADDTYQQSAVHATLAFPAGATWIVQTDAVSHAAMSGQYLLERTFLLPVDGMREPALSPLKILEGICGRTLA